MNKSTTNNERKNSRIERRPCRPFTPYNVFFQLERERILQEHGEGYAANPPKIIDDDLSARPPSYRNLILSKNWYIAGSKKDGRLFDKAKRRAHGVVTFVALSKQISENWAAVDEQVKAYCTLMSHEDTKRYRIEMDAFIEKYGYDSVKRTYKKRKNNVEFETKSGVSKESMERSDQVKLQYNMVDVSLPASDIHSRSTTKEINSQAPLSQRSMFEITPNVNNESPIVNRASPPNNISASLARNYSCVQIDTSNYSHRNDIINTDHMTANSVSLLQFGANDRDDNNDSNPFQVHWLRHQVSQDERNFPAICLEVTSSDNNHSCEHSEPDQNRAYFSVLDIEPLPINTVTCCDDNPIPFNSHNFDWSLDHGEFGDDPFGYCIENSTPSCPIVNTGMNTD